MTEDTKTCTKCKQTRLISEFNKDKSRTDGRFPQCKICAKADKAARKDKIKDYNAQYKKEHASEISESRKKYYQEHGEKERSDRRAYYQENRDKERASGEAYRRAHGGKSASKNVDCSLFLGTHITERAVRPILPNATHMPPSHPKYDYLCSQGYKIDVKSATTSHHAVKKYN